MNFRPATPVPLESGNHHDRTKFVLNEFGLKAMNFNYKPTKI